VFQNVLFYFSNNSVKRCEIKTAKSPALVCIRCSVNGACMVMISAALWPLESVLFSDHLNNNRKHYLNDVENDVFALLKFMQPQLAWEVHEREQGWKRLKPRLKTVYFWRSYSKKWGGVFWDAVYYGIKSYHYIIIKQELSYRKQIARQLRTQYVEGIYRSNYAWPWNLGQGSLKITGNGTTG